MLSHDITNRAVISRFVALIGPPYLQEPEPCVGPNVIRLASVYHVKVSNMVWACVCKTCDLPWD